MVAVKARFNHGKIDWEESPPLTGSCDLIVIFQSAEKTAIKNAPKASQAEKRRCIREIQEHFKKNIPPGVSLVDELIAERRLEAARE